MFIALILALLLIVAMVRDLRRPTGKVRVAYLTEGRHFDAPEDYRTQLRQLGVRPYQPYEVVSCANGRLPLKTPAGPQVTLDYHSDRVVFSGRPRAELDAAREKAVAARVAHG